MERFKFPKLTVEQKARMDAQQKEYDFIYSFEPLVTNYGKTEKDVFRAMETLLVQCTGRLTHFKRLLKPTKPIELTKRLKHVRSLFDEAKALLPIVEYFYDVKDDERCALTNSAVNALIFNARLFIQLILDEVRFELSEVFTSGLKNIDTVWVDVLCDFVHVCDHNPH